MMYSEQSEIKKLKPTLSINNLRAYSFQVLLISAAVLLPLAAHLSGAPVRVLLPMHWVVLLAGLVYGWRGGAITGFMAPIVSFLLSGFPYLPMLPSMTLELLTYGFIAGFLRENQIVNSYWSVAVALVAGRLVFIGSVLVGNSDIENYASYFQAALLPGIITGFAQIALLPFSAKWWVDQETKNKNEIEGNL